MSSTYTYSQVRKTLGGERKPEGGELSSRQSGEAEW